MAFLSSPQITALISLLPPSTKKNWDFPIEDGKGSQTVEISQLMNRLNSELRDLSDNDYAAGKAYERPILEEESRSDQNDEKKTWKYLLYKDNFGSSFTIKVS
ncbi:hypothetical protein TNCV_3213151 [Trichonephila clavipes]|nr:hypothetical protein TNCV_3213151 [Trichonephila clavipes]